MPERRPKQREGKQYDRAAEDLGNIVALEQDRKSVV